MHDTVVRRINISIHPKDFYGPGFAQSGVKTRSRRASALIVHQRGARWFCRSKRYGLPGLAAAEYQESRDSEYNIQVHFLLFNIESNAGSNGLINSEEFTGSARRT